MRLETKILRYLGRIVLVSFLSLKFGLFSKEDRYTTIESKRLVRLPINFGITEEEINHIIHIVLDFFDN